MQFKWYVINENINSQSTEMFNVFNNCKVQEHTEKAVKKYLRSPSKYTEYRWKKDGLYGFDALVKEIDSIIMWQEWGRCQYEFCDEFGHKWDCYEQCKPNMVSITHEVIRQYKEQVQKMRQLKEQKNE